MANESHQQLLTTFPLTDGGWNTSFLVAMLPPKTSSPEWHWQTGRLWPTDLVRKWGVGVLSTDHLERESPELLLPGGGEGRGVSLPTVHLSPWGVAVSSPLHHARRLTTEASYLTSLVGPASLVTLCSTVLVVPALHCSISTLEALFHFKKIPGRYYYWKGIKYRDQFRENCQTWLLDLFPHN